MVRLLSFVVAAFIFSCTIIEDGDITSQEELDNLKLLSVDIEQQTSGATNTSSAIVTKVLDVNLQPSGVRKQIWMDWPALGANSKLKVKSGATTAFKSYTSLLEGGKPYTFYLFSVAGIDTTILEQYSFRYNSSGRLATVITRVPFVEGALATSRDTLVYDTNGRLSGVTRNYPATGAAAAAFSSFNYQTSDNYYKLNQYIFQGLQYQGACQGGGCGSYWGGNYHVTPSSPSNGFPTGVMNVLSNKKAFLSIQDYNDLNQNNCGSPGCNAAWIDTFYLHPLMLLKDQLNAGDDLLFIYMVDWWKPVTTQQTTTNEKVIIQFNYDI
jgi:hypothetical protein